MDQPAGLIDKMKAALSIYNAVRALAQAKSWDELRLREPELYELAVNNLAAAKREQNVYS